MWETQKHLRQNIEVKRLRVQTLEDRARRVTTVMSDMPKAESRDPHKVYDQLMQAKMEYLLAIEKQSDFQDWLMELIDKTLDHEEDGTPVFYVPYVIGIRNGKIQGSHTSLVDGFKPKDASDQLSDEQRARLRSIFSDIISKTYR